MAKNKNTPVQMAKAEEGWFNKKRIVPFKEMSDEYLQAAIKTAERKELWFFNRAQVFSQLLDKLLDEAESRKLEVTHIPHEFTHNQLKGRNIRKDATTNVKSS